MLPGELVGIHNLHPINPILFSANFGLTQQINLPIYPFNRFSTKFRNNPAHEFTQQPPSFGNNSTSDKPEENQLKIINERKQRRMISNRESARRSRMRKQKRLDELWSQAVRLRNENHNLIDKLNHVSECHDRVLQENVRLKEETSDLRRIISDMRIGSPFTPGVYRDLDSPSKN